ncbi:MAG: helix-turn-helix transcriptional regulator [Lachnospiraceae bacterium]|nr:helix-turn-helix transcriptional regulator [Lachnospiraceae bacterium]
MENRNEEEIISFLQDNLSSVRKIAGWTTEEFGDKIGVTKQTISNLENKKTVMTRTQYIAIGAVLKYEIPNNKNSEVLAYVVNILLDDDKSYSAEERRKIKENIDMLVIASMGGMKGKKLTDFSEKIGIALVGAGVASIASAGGVISGVVAATAASTVWLGAILGTKANKKVKNKTDKNK